MSSERPIRVGISACLLGREVRFDGGHKRDRFLTDVLAPFVEFVPVCPEVELGLGVPRESVRLVLEGDAVRMRGNQSGADHTEAMRRFSERRARQLRRLDLGGYVLKKDSPSCGMERVRLYREHGPPRRDGRGLFAEALLAQLPDLPVEEEGRLNDPVLRENWIERLFAYHRLRALFAGRWTLGGLVTLHTAHKLQLLAHAPKDHAALGRLVAEGRRLPREALRERYTHGFMAALAKPATRRRHVNVLQHVAGHFRGRLAPGARRELAELVDDYGRGLVPLVVPLTLVRHHVTQLDVAYLRGQHYLEPHPKELMLRNHV